MRNNVYLLIIYNLLLFFNAKTQVIGTDNSDIRIFPSNNDQSEVHLSINKTNHLNLIVSANTKIGTTKTQGYYFTNDGGITWNGSDNMPNNQEGKADPSTAFDASGRAYISTLPSAYDGYLLQYSDDNCLTWSNSIRGVQLTHNISGGQDKEMIVCVDQMQTSPFVNNFYCSWTDFDDGSKVKINRSTNGGASFDNNITLSSRWGQGTNVQTGPDGEIYVCWADYINNEYPAKNIGFSYSNDGGINYSSSTAFAFNGIRESGGSNSKFGDTKINDYPSMAVDKSCGIHRGRIYIVYPELENSTSQKSVIRIKYSDDNGSSWSVASTINISDGRQNWFPWISIDDLTGLVTVIYYSLDQATGFSTNTYVAYSIDGLSWENIKISDQAHTTAPIDGYSYGYAGDYIGITSFAGSAYGAWMDNRNGIWQIYISKINFNTSPLTSSQSNLVINNPTNINGNMIYQAYQNIIVSDNNNVTIKNTANVEMVAGESIILKNGFKSEYNSTFNAKIESISPCTTPGAIYLKNNNSNWFTNLNVIKEENEGVKLFAYPNPSYDYITIGALNKKYKSINISISNINGKIIANFDKPNVSEDHIRQIIDLSNYSNGSYIATVLLDGKKYTIKFNKL